MRELPSSWAWALLADVASWGSGGTPTAGDPRFYGGEIPWAVIGDLTDATVTETANSITNEGLASSSAKVVPEGTLLIAMYGSIGKLGITGRPMATNQAIAFACVDKRIIENGYLFWFLSSERNEFMHAGKGATQKNISQTVLKSWTIPLPPLPEQRRIVATLDHHLSRLAAADQSILTGLRRVRRLRKSIVDQVFNDVMGASTERLESLLAEPLRNGHSARASDTGEGIRTLTLTAVTKNEFTDFNTKLTVADPARVRDLWLRPGDILVERANTPDLVGISALYTGPPEWAIYPDLVIRLRVNEAVMPEYVQLIFSTTRLRSYFRQNAKGLAGSMPKIDQDTLLRAELPIPSIEEQGRIVASINNHKDAIDRLHRELEISRSRSSQFRRSLLAEAFAGQLVPQDPADEPASVLLDRIRAERAAHPSAGRGRSRAIPSRQKETLL
jgi:type I restriction enzyme, S subunit